MMKDIVTGFMADTPPKARSVRNYSMLLAAVVTALISAFSKFEIDLPNWLDIILYTVQQGSIYLTPLAQTQTIKK